ncbi:MAG: GNAT family N-acetyltransferase [Gemmatimonadaceae bacterium]
MMSATDGFSLRAARRGDLPSLERLIEHSVRALSVGYYSREQIDSALRFMFGVDTRLVDSGSYHVVERERSIVAAGGWSAWGTLFGGDHFKDIDEPRLDPAVDPARIRAFFVDPGWTRRGLARMLFDSCASAAKASGFRSLELMATLPGEPLYRALGFREEERVELTLPDGIRMPLVRMRRPLEG